MLKIIVQNKYQSIFMAKVDFFIFQKNEKPPTKYARPTESLHFQQESKEEVLFCHA